MNTQEFTKLALRTESTSVCEVNPRIEHAIYGLNTEATEALVWTDLTNLKEEIGDCLWYMAILCDELGIEMSDTEVPHRGVQLEEQLKLVVAIAGDSLDHLKKVKFYGKALDTDLLTSNMEFMQCKLKRVCKSIGTTVEQEMERVIRKLQIRYPNKFTKEDALNRNLEAELEVLEGL